MSVFRAVMAATVMLAAAACGNAAAAPAPRAAAPVAAPASVRLVHRLARQSATVVPDVTGLTVAAARARLPELAVNVVRFDRAGGRVSAQWPMAGESQPSDGVMVVWVGSPPRPRAAPARPVAAQAAAQTPVAPPDPASQAPVPTPGVPTPGVPTPGVTPGLERVVLPPHAPRANIRTMPAPPAGTILAGRTSWYGPGFQGRGTACGTTFDPAKLTLASRELPCGTTVVVTGPAGSVEATVTDWGPAEWTGRRFDLSQATFDAVASLGSGVIDATVEVR